MGMMDRIELALHRSLKLSAGPLIFVYYLHYIGLLLHSLACSLGFAYRKFSACLAQ